MEEPILGYIRDASVLPNVVARVGDEVVGVCLHPPAQPGESPRSS